MSVRYSNVDRSSLSEQFHDFAWMAHPKRVWDFVRIARRQVSEDGTPVLHVVSVQYSDEGVVTVPEVETFPFDPSHSAQLKDLCEMNNLHEAPLLYTLEKRMERGDIYTAASNIVISINPYRHIPNLFDNPLDYYEMGRAGEGEGDQKQQRPHVYAVASKVLHSLVNAGEDDMKNQSVVISGESGAGKTEASKYVMRFLIAVNDASLSASAPQAGQGDIGARIRDVLVDTNIVLEAFGNAKTVRNDNSSRFGKYTKLQYTADDKLSSAHTQTFLLEKSRLTAVGAKERNYHVLYQVAKGTDSSLDKEGLRLSSVNDFRILISGACTVAGKQDNDVELFTELCDALRTLGANDVEMTRLWELLAAILHMGNIRVQGSDGACGIESPSMPLEGVAALLGCSEDDITRSLLYHVVKVSSRASVSMKQLTPDETANNILALMKWLYNGIFTWLVSKLNAAYALNDKAGNSGAGAVGAVTKFIGILDIFGFETLLTNSFEQLCINFANERLQQQFNEQVFVFEQIEYQKEGLNWSSVTFRDNQPVIDLISKKPSGLLNILEEHGMMNRKPDDTALLTSYGQQHYQKHPAYDKPRFGADTFIVKHFAGDVSYIIEGFLNKNNDSLQDDLLELMKSSHNAFLLNVMGLSRDETAPGFIPENLDVVEVPPAGAAAAGPPKPAASAAGGKKMASAMTVSFQFRHQLDSLVSTLRATKPHYVKCLKPNTEKSPDDFDPALVMEQLRYSGILEVVRIRREGYPTRLAFRDFYNKYYLLGFHQGLKRPKDCAECDDAEIKRLAGVVASFVLADEDPAVQKYQLGHNKIFLRDGCLNAMSSALLRFKKQYCLRIQSWHRCRQASRHYKLSRVGALLFQKVVRQCLARKRLQEKRNAWAIVNRYVSREFRRRKAARIVAELRAEDATRRKAAAELAEKLRLEEEARRIAEEARLRQEMSLNIQIWASSRARQRVSRRHYLIVVKAVKRIQNRARVMLARKKRIRLQKDKFAGAVRVIMSFAHIARSRTQQRRNRKLVAMIVLDDGEGVAAHLRNFPKDESLVLRLPSTTEFRQPIYMMAYFGSIAVLNTWQPPRSKLINPDVNGRHSFHHWAMGPCLDISFALELFNRCRSGIMMARGSVNAPSPAGNSSFLMEGWIRKKRPGNKFEKRWATLEPTVNGVKLSYYKSKGDKTSKGEVDLQRTEEALTVRRVPIQETSGASDELFQFEIFSPIGLAHKSKTPVMFFNVQTEAELHQWLAPLKHGIGCKPSSPTKGSDVSPVGSDRFTDARVSSLTDTNSNGVSRKFRPQFCADSDALSNTPLHLLCRRRSDDANFDSAVRAIFTNSGTDMPEAHFLTISPLRRDVHVCTAALWVLTNCSGGASFLCESLNDQDQTVLHMAGLGGSTALCGALSGVAARLLATGRCHDDDATTLTKFLCGKDQSGKTPKSYLDTKPVDISDMSLSESSTPSQLFDIPAAVSVMLNLTAAVSHLPQPPVRFGGLSYLSMHIFSFDMTADFDPVQDVMTSSGGIRTFPVKLAIRTLSSNGYWLCDMNSDDVAESVLSVLESPPAEPTKMLRACFGHCWNLSVPLQNLDEGATVFFELKRCDNDTTLGWSYFNVASEFSQVPGLAQFHVFTDLCPVSLGAGDAPPGVPVTLPAFPERSAVASRLEVEYYVQCA